MNKKKVASLALAAAILASSGGVAGSVFTAAPAEAATVASYTSAPANFRAFTNPTTFQSGVAWGYPAHVTGTVRDYTVTLKQAGKPDRIYTTRTGQMMFGTTGVQLFENTAYTAQVKANVFSRTGARLTSAVASTTFKTGWAPNRIKATAPVGLRTTDVGVNSFVARWAPPVGYVGTVTGYTVTLKQSGVALKTVSVSPSTLSYKEDALKAASAYTVEVKATYASANKMVKASSAASTVVVATAKPVVTNLKPIVTISNITSKSAVMNWKTIPGATTYLTFVSEKGGQLVSRGEASANATSASTYASLKPGTTYLADVQAVIPTADGKSWTAYSSGMIEFTTASAAPVGLAPVVTISDITSNSATINWTPSSAPNLSIYMVGIVEKGAQATGPGTRWGPDRTSIGTGAWLKPNTTYIVSVQAFLTAPDSAKNTAYTGTTEFTTKG